MKIKNCFNCGAPLHGSRCDYCGTECNENGSVIAVFDKDGCCGELQIGGVSFQVYLSRMVVDSISDGFRDQSGRLHVRQIAKKRTFTLIEM